MRLLCSIIFIFLHITLVVSRVYSTSAYGRIVCNGKPAVNVRLQLNDKNIFWDKKVQETTTNNNGEFRLFGSIDTWFDFIPYIEMRHKCNYQGFCFRVVTFYIPPQYVTKGSIPAITYDVGTLNLNNPSLNQTIVCQTR